MFSLMINQEELLKINIEDLEKAVSVFTSALNALSLEIEFASIVEKDKEIIKLSHKSSGWSVMEKRTTEKESRKILCFLKKQGIEDRALLEGIRILLIKKGLKPNEINTNALISEVLSR